MLKHDSNDVMYGGTGFHNIIVRMIIRSGDQ